MQLTLQPRKKSLTFLGIATHPQNYKGNHIASDMNIDDRPIF